MCPVNMNILLEGLPYLVTSLSITLKSWIFECLQVLSAILFWHLMLCMSNPVCLFTNSSAYAFSYATKYVTMKTQIMRFLASWVETRNVTTSWVQIAKRQYGFDTLRNRVFILFYCFQIKQKKSEHAEWTRKRRKRECRPLTASYT